MYRLKTIYITKKDGVEQTEESVAEFESVDDMIKYSDHLYKRNKADMEELSKKLEESFAKSLEDYIPGEDEIKKEDLN